MKRCLKKIFLLPLLLLTPSLMAFKEENADFENEYYYDISVNYEPTEHDGSPYFYEFFITNTGNNYIERNYIFVKSTDDEKVIYFYSTWKYGELENKLIKPGETCQLYSYLPDEEDKILKDSNLTFYTTSHKPRNDVMSVNGSYSLSLKKEKRYTSLMISCNIERLKELEEYPKIKHEYHFAISLTYDGAKYCLIGDYINNKTIKVAYDSSFDLDVNKLTIDKIECFVDSHYCLDDYVNPKLVILWIVLVICVVATILAFAIISICKLKRRIK